MKLTGFILSFAIAIGALLFVAPSADAKKVEVYSRTFLRPDKSKTVSIRDDNKMRKELRTYSRRGVLIWKGIYRLDKYGRSRSAEIFDAQNKLLFRASYGFDNKGRLRRELFHNSKGQLVRAIDYEFDRYGKALKPKAYNIKVIGGKYKRMEASDYHSTHPGSMKGVTQAAAAASAGRPSPSRNRSGKTSSRRRATGGGKQSRVNASRGGSSLLIPRGNTSRYRSR